MQPIEAIDYFSGTIFYICTQYNDVDGNIAKVQSLVASQYECCRLTNSNHLQLVFLC